MRFLFLDDVYPEAWKLLGDSVRELHGTADHWDIALRAAGHESGTFLENASPGKWHTAAGDPRPDVVCVQNVGRWPVEKIAQGVHYNTLRVAFVSYRASDEAMTGWDCVFTSFPWLVDHLEKLGQRVEFLPLAFGSSIIDRVEPQVRDLPLTFIGGIGHRHIWESGTDLINAVAEAFPKQFKWWGYRPSQLPVALENSWQGEAWGERYFELLMRSQITINRHGEIAKGYANNMRLFEATGCGACLATEHSENIRDYFKSGVECLTYRSAEDLVYILRAVMGKAGAAERIARCGMQRCFSNHLYSDRVGDFLKVVESL